MNKIQLFESKKIRSVWDEKTEEWYMSLVDVIGVLTDSVNPTDYLKKLRKRDEILGDYIGTNCPQVEMPTETGKSRKTLSATPKQLFALFNPYVIDKKRMENGTFLGEDYFERLLAEIREIRLSERRFYQKIT
ncbi:MAG: virulence RhuM family protein [Bacteroidales bacterium]|nr:virulence RhuM family protein [Bacteroidales bacterium]